MSSSRTPCDVVAVARIFVSGKVQGVYYRDRCAGASPGSDASMCCEKIRRRQALCCRHDCTLPSTRSCVKKGTMLGITGRAWNLSDGRVEVHCEGTQVVFLDLRRDAPDSDAWDGTGRHS